MAALEPVHQEQPVAASAALSPQAEAPAAPRCSLHQPAAKGKALLRQEGVEASCPAEDPNANGNGGPGG
eukprot:CAMPEP_0202046464 /NCGR_PEP_ID=MMETSP0963-20130614/1321_1 /ASSEMBLY_ACC=CAM_ASM_000494 /TAXON_ID=4773 /ORGANISM="Schizochytrium aggregatum, Strain ATCC28209" /LENGTH=68 /DNA_ID=CAMNT_0048611119 /DNA_START=81 /DNA_END=285 /DNA_ORIENTATION=-